MKLKDDEYLSRSGRILMNSDMHLDASATAVDNNKNRTGNEDDSEDDDSSRANLSVVAATRSFRGMDWEDEKEEEQLFCAKFVIEPKVLRWCCLLGMLSGLLTGWEIGTTFGDDYDYYFQFRCPSKDDELRYELYPDCEPIPIEKQDRLEMLKLVVEVVAQVLAAMILSPIISDGWGRKRTFIFGAVTNCIGAIFSACSVNIQMIYTFRTFSTLGLGLLNAAGTVYLSEVSPIHRRGRYTTLWFVGASFGFVVASLFNVLLREVTYGWRVAYVGDIILCLSIIALALWSRVPESHHFYILQRRYDEALRVLKSIRVEETEGPEEGNEVDDRERQHQKAVDDAIVQWEYQGLIQERNETIGKNTLHTFWNKYRNLLLGGRAPPQLSTSSMTKGKKKKKKKHKYSPRMPQRLLYGCLLQIFDQFSGIRAIAWYLTSLVSAVYGVDKTENWNIAIYCFNCVAATLCYLSIEKIGRPMILFSGGLVIFVLLLMAYFVDRAIAQGGGYPSQADAGYFLILFIFYEMGYSYSWGPVTYVYCAEVFDIGTRAAGVGITTAIHAISSAILRLFFISYHTYLPEFYQHMTFLGSAALSFLFVYYFLPETSNKTSNEIGKNYRNHRPALLRLDWGPN